MLNLKHSFNSDDEVRLHGMSDYLFTYKEIKKTNLEFKEIFNSYILAKSSSPLKIALVIVMFFAITPLHK